MDSREEECSVAVCVHIRPLIPDEEEAGCAPCLNVSHGEPQVAAGPHSFRYDHVFGGDCGLPALQLYDKCVAPLVDALFKGYNATVFAYGQTGSGKTYTMGSSFTPGGSTTGVIPNVMEAIFERVARTQDVDFTVRVGFVEIHKDDIRDLIVSDTTPQAQVHIREVLGGGICLAGANEREVRTKEQMVEILQQGTLLRATAATGMNKRSSRSHAIFTITLEQRKLAPPRSLSKQEGDEESGEEEEGGESDADQDSVDDSYLCAKMHLVDLAGSERAKRTKAVGQRLQEGININKGLLALGNVICALSEGKQHVPYRDSKLTRMLQDSLGGNSRTVMIACVSPADVNLEETVNTLRYASRARNIRNKPVVNRDPVAAQIAHLRQQLAAAKAENHSLKRRLGNPESGGKVLFGDGQDAVMAAALEELEQRNKRLEMQCNRLRVESESLKQDLTEATEKMIVAQAQRDRLAQKLEQVDAAAAEEVKASLGLLAGAGGQPDEVVSHLQRIAELEREVKRLRQVSRVSGAFVINSRRQSLAPDGALPPSPLPFALSHLADNQDAADYLSDLELNDDEFAAEEQAHRHEMSRVQAQIAQLQQQLEEKEARMQVVGGHALVKQAYGKQLKELQAEVEQLQKERLKLLQELQDLQHNSEEERLKMEMQYKGRLKAMDDKLKSLKSKEKRIMELERIKRQADETCKRLQSDCQSIKQQKVSLLKEMERKAREFAEFTRQRDKELLQLRKQGRANAAQLQKLEAFHQKQQAVLKRKTEEAEAARKRLKELEQRKIQVPSRPNTALDRPASAAFDRPATAASGPITARLPAPMFLERSMSNNTSSGSPPVDCQPNQMAPLLRDEKSRREWVESELDACCASYDLQRVVEGEKALRSECARKLREVEKKLAALKNPNWWPNTTMSPGSQSEQYLLKQKMDLHRQLDMHSKQIADYQLQLMKVKQNEEEKGGGAADARRWNGLRTIVEARTMLKTVFRSASQHKAQAYETQLQVTEALEEVELLRLRLDIAEQEKLEQANLAAKAHAAVVAAQAQAASPGSSPDVVLARLNDATDAEADSLIEQLSALPANLLDSIPEGGREGADVGEEEEEEEEDDFDLEESEEEPSSDEEGDRWDPSLATPAVKRKKAHPQHAAAAQQPEQSRRQSGGGAAARRSSTGAGTPPEEMPVLEYINEERCMAGEEPCAKLTVPILKQHLRGKIIRGQEWRAGSRKRDDFIADFREFLGLQPATGAVTSLVEEASHSQPPSRLTSQGDAAVPSTHGFDRPPFDTTPLMAQPDGAFGGPPLVIPPPDVEEPGSHSPTNASGGSSPMQLLRALNPFGKQHARSRSDVPQGPFIPAARHSGGSGSVPATPTAMGAAALLEKSAACMQRAAEINSMLQTHKKYPAPAGAGATAAGGGAAPALAVPAVGSLVSSSGGSGSGGSKSSPRGLLGWMGFKSKEAAPAPSKQANAADASHDTNRGVQPLGERALPLPLERAAEGES